MRDLDSGLGVELAFDALSNGDVGIGTGIGIGIGIGIGALALALASGLGPTNPLHL